MLSQITISNYAIVDRLEIELHNGMTVITGETGAGKSIMLDALGLALGDRADKDVIRDGADRTDISASFLIGNHPEARTWLQNHDFPGAGHEECILRRVVLRDGPSRAYINGQPTTVNELRELGDMLIDIHSQHEHQSLLKQATHQRLLDEYCGHTKLAGSVRDIALRWRALQQELDELSSQARENNAQIDLLGYQIKELDELGLEPGELEALEEEQKSLSHAEASLTVIRQVLDICRDNEEHNIEQALHQAQSLLQDMPYADTHAEAALDMLSNALIQVEEAGSELARSADHVELDPSRLQEVDQRLSSIHLLARKHRVAPAHLTDRHQDLRSQLAQLAKSDIKQEALREELNALQEEYCSLADRLSKLRQEGARKLEQEINSQLDKLGMNGANFLLDLRSEPSDKPSPGGFEHCEFLVSTNPGQAPKAMIKVASGGELSRISLAIQVVTAQTSTIPTLVFDEVDVGIGGGVARTVGELLRTLGARGQILCVTHQPQVASQSHHHLFVSKTSDQAGTQTSIRVLDKQERVEEVARMLGGDKLSDQSVAHAQQLMVS